MAKLNLLAVIAVAILPVGCTSLQQVQVPKEIRVAVHIPCVDPADRPARPQFRAIGDLLQMDRYARTLAAWSDLRKYEAYAAELEAVVEGCSRLRAVPETLPAR